MNQMNDSGSEQSAMLLKILTIGDTAVGKTCLIMQFSEGGFQPSFITTVGIGTCTCLPEWSDIYQPRHTLTLIPPPPPLLLYIALSDPDTRIHASLPSPPSPTPPHPTFPHRRLTATTARYVRLAVTLPGCLVAYSFLPNQQQTPRAADYKRKIVKLDDQKFYKLTIWDTAGQERFRTITHAYFRGSHGMLLVFDVGARKTFENIKHWMDQIHAHTKNQVDSPPPKVVLIGNKCDLPAAQRQELRRWACGSRSRSRISRVPISARSTPVMPAFCSSWTA